MHPELIADRYELLEEIATGARSTVFRARDVRSQQVVAVKRRPQSLAAFFERERTALAGLKHANIVQLIDSGTDASGNYLALEYVEGETLGSRISRDPLPSQALFALARQTLSALAAIHAEGFLHRDIAPDNLLLSPHEGGSFEMKLIDFELAQRIAEPVSDAATGSVHFMAPEQFENRLLDERTDLYALGAVLYSAAAGEYPFNGDTNAQVITAHLRHVCEPLVTHPLGGWISLLISREPSQRPANAAAALEAIPRIA